MRVFILFCILVVGFFIHTAIRPNFDAGFVIHTFAQRSRTATRGDVVVGELKKSSSNRVMINWTPCGEVTKIVIFSGNFKVKNLGSKTCNNGTTYDAVRVTQQ